MSRNLEPYPSVVQLADSLRRGETTPSALASETITKIRELNPELNALAFVDESQIMAQAAANDQLWQVTADKSQLPAFFGVPLPIKELTEIAGAVACYGMAEFQENIAPYDHALTKRFRHAGFQICGQSISCALGCLPVTEGAFHGITRNPLDPTLSPGGSSGGAAAAVAAGIFAAAHGSDGGGSLRIPAASCGIVGFKTSRGLLPIGPAKAWPGLSSHGVLTRNVSDQAAILAQLHCHETAQWSGFPRRHELDWQMRLMAPGTTKIAFTTQSPFGTEVDADYSEAIIQLATKLAAAGFEVSEQPLAINGDLLREAFLVQWAAMVDLPDRIVAEPHIEELRRRARNSTALDLHRAQLALQGISRGIISQFADCDFYLTPSLGQSPPRAGAIWELCQENVDDVVAAGFAFSPFTQWVNVTGQPAISLPIGPIPGAKIPASAHIIGRPWQDDDTLRMAFTIEQLLDPASGG